MLRRIIPVAEHAGVQMAVHLEDPPAPDLAGVEMWNWPVFEGCQRFSELVDSPMHGFNFCCGTASEGLDDPATELCPIVQHFAERGKIFHVHFRNIRGGLHDFEEVWPDEGDVDMHELAATLFDAGYDYMLDPDHAPSHEDDPDTSPRDGQVGGPYPHGSGRVTQGFAFQFGFVIATIQAVKRARGAGWSEARTVATAPHRHGMAAL
jgi:mannonate dehydratase|eukprot:SAG25_NODE_1189_length_3658_cov_19.857263_2_plen_207_part_00